MSHREIFREESILVFQSHISTVMAIFQRCFHKKSLIEVGCVHGYIFRHLQENGCTVTGIVPAYEGGSPAIIKSRFVPGFGLNTETIVLRHALDPNTRSGQIVVTIPNVNHYQI